MSERDDALEEAALAVQGPHLHADGSDCYDRAKRRVEANLTVLEAACGPCKYARAIRSLKGPSPSPVSGLTLSEGEVVTIRRALLNGGLADADWKAALALLDGRKERGQ